MTRGDDRQLDLVVDFLNTVDIETGSDELRDAPTFQAWLRAHQLPGSADLGAARRFRAVLRAAAGDRAEGADSGAGPAAADPADTEVQVVVTLGSDGRPTLASADALGLIAAAAVRLADDGRWDRVRVCTAGDCRWAFFDRSKNRSRHWCSMGVCGNRAKSRAFRERRRSGSTGTAVAVHSAERPGRIAG